MGLFGQRLVQIHSHVIQVFIALESHNPLRGGVMIFCDFKKFLMCLICIRALKIKVEKHKSRVYFCASFLEYFDSGLEAVQINQIFRIYVYSFDTISFLRLKKKLLRQYPKIKDFLLKLN